MAKEHEEFIANFLDANEKKGLSWFGIKNNSKK